MRTAILTTMVMAVAVTACASADVGPAPVDEAAAARATAVFERMKGLEGVWVSSGAEGAAPDAEIHYEVTSAGSALVETIFPGAQHEMVSVYYLDNGRLVMTHYCAMNNQPHMVAEPGGSDDVVQFTCVGAGNTESHADAHMHMGEFTFGDGTLHTEWTMFTDLERGGTVVLDLVRGDG